VIDRAEGKLPDRASTVDDATSTAAIIPHQHRRQWLDRSRGRPETIDQSQGRRQLSRSSSMAPRSDVVVTNTTRAKTRSWTARGTVPALGATTLTSRCGAPWPRRSGRQHPGAPREILSSLLSCQENKCPSQRHIKVVVLRGRLSNFDVQDFVRDVGLAVSERRPGPSVAATHGSRSSFEPVRLRLGDEAVAELVAAFVAGTTREELADHYGVSLSSVKRLLRGARVRRRHSRSAGGPEQ
jgi:hypothetical protein